MTSINDIADLARILKEQPEWADTIRSILLSEELLNLPARFAEFVQLTQESNRLTNERLNRLEGRMGNLEGSDYERKVRYRAMSRAQLRFGLDNPYLALTQSDPASPRLTSAIAQAIGNGAISLEQSEDLYDTDIIISDEGNRHVTIEVSLTADKDDIDRVNRRAGVLSAATGGTVTPAIITASLNDAQQEQAAAEEVAAFIIPYP